MKKKQVKRSSIKHTLTNLKRLDLGYFFYTICWHHILQCENVIISQNRITLIISFFGGSNNIFADCTREIGSVLPLNDNNANNVIL